MKAHCNYPKALPIIIITVLTLELLSVIALKSAGGMGIPWPWDFMTLLAYGFVRPVITAFAALMLLWICGLAGWYRKRLNLSRGMRLLTKALQWIMGGIGFLVRCCRSSASTPFGRAHFANHFDLVRHGFLHQKEESVIVGKRGHDSLYSNGFEHLLVFAPSGAGKTTSISMPNLFHFPYSCVVNDVKLTLFNTTSKYRETTLGHQCYLWNLSSKEGQTHRYNPLSNISHDPRVRMTEIQRMAHVLIPDGKGELIWYQASRKLFKALVLYLLDHPTLKATLGQLTRLIKQPRFDEWLTKELENSREFSPEFYRNGFSYLGNHFKTRSSILETFSGYLELFDDPVIDMATSETDFDIKSLRMKKITIYVGFNNDDLERLSTLITLFWEQTIGGMLQTVPNLEQEPYPVLMLLDEFSSLGKIERLRRALVLLREYRVRVVLMLQYLAQTREKYTDAEAKAFTNVKTKIAYTPDNLEDAEYLSKLLGTKTTKVPSRSDSHHKEGQTQTTGIQLQSTPLLRPDEVLSFPKSHNLIVCSGVPPIKATPYVWYHDDVMRHCNVGKTEVPTHAIVIPPFIHKSIEEE